MDRLTISQRIKIIKTYYKNFSNKIFCHEAHFTRGEYVNKQNCHVWDSENSQVIEERPLHPEKVTVWCVLCCKGVTGLYFFENDDGSVVTVHSEFYSHMITDFFLPDIEEYDLETYSTRWCPMRRHLLAA